MCKKLLSHSHQQRLQVKSSVIYCLHEIKMTKIKDIQCLAGHLFGNSIIHHSKNLGVTLVILFCARLAGYKELNYTFQKVFL